MLWLIRYQLRSKDAAARRKAAEELSQDPNPRALRVLLTVLQDKDPEVVQTALSGIRGKVSGELVAALPPLLRHTNPGVRAEAALALEAVGWLPPNAEEQAWLAAAKGQMVRAASFGRVAIGALEAMVINNPPTLRAAAIEALGAMGAGEKVLPPLLEALKAEESPVCIAAVGAVCRVGSPQIIGPLLDLLNRKDPQIRLTVAEALGTVEGTPEAVESLKRLLKDPIWDVRRATAETLGRWRDARAVEALMDALTDSDGDVRESVVKALAELRDRRAVRALILSLKDPVSRVRRLVAGALARTDSDWSALPEAGPAFEELKSALEDSDADVRHFVGQLLAGVGVMKQEAAPETKAEIPRALSAKARRQMAAAMFLSMLEDPDRDLRQAAAEVLGRLGDRKAETALLTALTDTDAGVRLAAEQALQVLDHTGT